MHHRPRLRRGRAGAILAALLVGALALTLPGSAQTQTAFVAPAAWPATGLPGARVVPIGGSPLSAPDEVWGLASTVRSQVATPDKATRLSLVRQRGDGSWQHVSRVEREDGRASDAPDLLGAGPGPARVTPRGGIAFAAAGGELFVRPAAGRVRAVREPDATLLGTGQRVVGTDRATLAAVDEGTATGLFVAPVGRLEDRVLHHDGTGWTGEDIDLPGGTTTFKVAAIAGESADAMWLVGHGGDGVKLFERDTAGPGTPEWKPVTLTGAKSFITQAGARPLGYPAEGLTVVSGGLWIDARADVSGANRDVIMYFDTSRREVTRTWCDGTDGGGAALCDAPLGITLPPASAPDADTGDQAEAGTSETAGYRSFAWAGSGFGTRVITNVDLGAAPRTANGAGYAAFDGSTFRAVRTGVPRTLSSGGAFTSTTTGWTPATDWALTRIAPSPPSARLQAYPVPSSRAFRAIAIEPGRSASDPQAQALAVGDDGRVVRYGAERGWVAEPLLTGSGRATPRLNGVAWPEPTRAHAVGANGEMWLWRAETGLWERDENAPQDLVSDQFMAVGFQPGNPDRGYAITDAGRIFSYGKGWSEDPVPGLARADSLVSLAFAGSTALVAAQSKLLVNDGGGWQVDTQAGELLREYADGRIYAVAGLPDGGAVVAGRGAVIVRDRAGEPWRLGDHQISGIVSSLAAVRDGDRVRAVAVLVNPASSSDPFTEPDPADFVDEPGRPQIQFPATQDIGWATVVRETASGWVDDTRSTYRPDAFSDCPVVPDTVRALALDPSGEGWIVGGDGTVAANRTCGPIGGADGTTSAIWRYGAAPAPPPVIARTQAAFPAGRARLLLGGHASCSEACANVAIPGHAPDRYLASALDVAAELHATTGGPRALLYTGTRVSPFTAGDAAEQRRYASLIGTATGRVPVYVAPSGTDAASDAGVFSSAFGGQPAPQGNGWAPGNIATGGVLGGEQAGGARTHYAFNTQGPEGPLRVVVIDNSRGSLAESDAHQVPAVPGGQREWLIATLRQARAQGIPTVVMGSRPLGDRGVKRIASDPGPGEGQLFNYHVRASDGDDVARLLVEHGASAYLFDAADQNLVTQVPENATETIPAIGSGALGYAGSGLTDAGFAMVEFDLANRNPATNRVPVSSKIVPVLEDITLDPRDGTQIRRSSPALFVGLGRRPRAGRQYLLPGSILSPERPVIVPYVDIPNEACRRQSCSIDLDFSFSSSNPEVGDFVRTDPARPSNPRAVFLGQDSKPVSDPQSALFCAFNPGETTIRVTAGGLSYSTVVRVLAGSPRQPCGTRPVTSTDAPRAPAPSPTPPPASVPPSVAANPTIAPPPPVAVAVPAPVAPPAATPVVSPPPPASILPSLPPLPALPPPIAPLATPLPPIPPPPVGSVARPSPPGGATVRVYEEKREEEEAFEQSSAAVRYEPGAATSYPNPAAIVGMALLAAAAGTTIVRRRPGRSRRTIARQQVH